LQDYVAPQLSRKKARKELRQLYNNETRALGENDLVTQVGGRRVIVREENFEKKGSKEENEGHFYEMYDQFQRRAQAGTRGVENYDDVLYWPYEWLLKVGTEYYFRYEGTMPVPPCFETVHWRVMKDPIRVAPHQMRELERLIAARTGESGTSKKCESDTAGKPRATNLDLVDVNRPLQRLHTLHRMVFCECKDWPSKFPLERVWCKNWSNRDPRDRLYENPYNWPGTGF
jgi:hypothetical protein